MRDLIAALEQVRLRVLRVIAALEEGDDARALAELEVAQDEWQTARQQLSPVNGNGPTARLGEERGRAKNREEG